MDVRPLADIPYSVLETFIEVVSVPGLIITIMYLQQNWSKVPESVPSGFGLDGRPNRLVGKTVLLIIPVSSVLLYVVMSLMSPESANNEYPHGVTYDNLVHQHHIFRTTVSLMKMEFVWMAAIGNWQHVCVALGRKQRISPWLMFSPILPFLTFGIGFFTAYQAR